MVVLAISTARDAKRAEVDAVSVKSLAAIVQRGTPAPAVTEQALRAQAEALSKLEARGLSFLPVRFGTVVASEAELKQLLAPIAKQLADALALTRGRRQMTVRVRGKRVPAPRSSGRAFLVARAREARVPGADPIRKAVARLVVAEQTGAARGPYSGAVYHLLDESNVPKYIAAVAALQRLRPGRFVMSGPMPPFAFTSVADIGGGA